MTRHRTRPVAVVLRHGRGCPRAALARARAHSVDPEPEVWGRPKSAEKAGVSRKVASDPVGKRDIGCATPAATGAEIRPVLSTGLLAADVRRNIFPDRQRQFGPDLVGGVL